MKSKLQAVFCVIVFALSTMALTTNLAAQAGNNAGCTCCDQCCCGGHCQC